MSPEKKAVIDQFGKAIARQLNARRAHQDMTQNDLAQATGISQSQISKQLRGIRSINMDELALICAALNISTIEIIRMAEREITPKFETLNSNVRSLPTPDIQGDTYDDGTVTEWDDQQPHAADSSTNENEERMKRGEDPID